LGHTPFGHAGEEYLNNILIRETGHGFYHNMHGVRILDKGCDHNSVVDTMMYNASGLHIPVNSS
jgi:dGTPase